MIYSRQECWMGDRMQAVANGSADEAADSRWMTYTELAAARRITMSSAIKLVVRRGWRRQKDNHGTMRALVPPDWWEPARGKNGDADAYVSEAIGALETSVTVLRERAEAAEQMARLERERADRAVQAHDGELMRDPTHCVTGSTTCAQSWRTHWKRWRSHVTRLGKRCRLPNRCERPTLPGTNSDGSSALDAPGEAIGEVNRRSSPAHSLFPSCRLGSRPVTSGAPVIGEMIQLCGVAAFLRRTVSLDVVRHASRSVLYFSDVWSPCIGGS